MSIGFNSKDKNGDKKDKYEGNTTENYNHVVRLLGVPVFSSTKKHIIDTHSVGKPNE